VAEVVTTINIPTMAKAMDAHINTFVAIFCIVIVYQLKHYPQITLSAPQAGLELSDQKSLWPCLLNSFFVFWRNFPN